MDKHYYIILLCNYVSTLIPSMKFKLNMDNLSPNGLYMIVQKKTLT